MLDILQGNIEWQFIEEENFFKAKESPEVQSKEVVTVALLL